VEKVTRKQGRIQGGAKGAIALPPWPKKGKRRERKEGRKKERKTNSLNYFLYFKHCPKSE